MKIFSFLFLMMMCVCGLEAGTQIVHKSNILVTEKGIFYSYEGSVIPSQTLTYLGDGYYAAEYHGSCKRCGWALDEMERCTNQNCEQYGPRRD